jgi:hypothetical protein
MKRVLFVLVCVCVATSVAENVVSVNFENWGSIEQDRYAGVVDVANWNDTWLDNGKVSPMTDLRDSTGATTTMSVAWTGGEWGIRLWDGNASGVDTDGRRNVSLMKGYLDAHAPESTTATFTDIPYASYDVYVYVMSDVANRAGSVTVGDATYYFRTDPDSLHFTAEGTADYVEFKEITAADADSAVRSNYAVFRGVTGSSFTVSATVADGGGIAGVQIVEDVFRPVVIPEHEDGSVGTLISQNEVEVSFGWSAVGDPDTDRAYPVHPDTVGYYIYLSLGGKDDPNLYLLDYVEQVYAEDPYETDPYNEYGPILLGQSTTYYWQIEQAMDDGTGNPYGAGDPNNITGPVWSFTTIGATPRILSGPEHTVADFDGNASFSVTTGAVATHFRWFKVGDPDTQLADGGIYSGTQTDTLFITGAASDGSDDARVYAIAYNGDPEKGGIPSAPSAAAWFWYPRLVNHYPFETTYEVEEVTITPDIVSGYDAMLLSNDTGQDIPVLAAGMPELEGDFALKFDNPRGTDPNVADAQYAQVSEGWAGGYKDITISAWVYSSGGSNWNRILDFGNDTNNYMFLCVNPGSVNRQVRFAVKVAGNEQSVSSAAEALPDNTWVHVAATLTGTTGRIYINGELAGTNTSMTLDPVSYGPSVNNWIARSQWGAGDGYFNGMLDDLKIYNYARTTEQIAQDYLGIQGGWVCNYELYDLPYDFNGDCTVDLADFAIFAAAWLDSYRIYPE